MPAHAFCQRLAKALTARQLSRNQLVHLGGAGFTYRKIQAYCAGDSAPTLAFLALLGRLGLDVHYLVTGNAAGNVSQIDTNASASALAQLAHALVQAQAALATLKPLLESGPVEGQALSVQEVQLLAAFRAAPPGQQEMVFGMLVSKLDDCDKIAKAK